MITNTLACPNTQVALSLNKNNNWKVVQERITIIITQEYGFNFCLIIFPSVTEQYKLLSRMKFNIPYEQS